MRTLLGKHAQKYEKVVADCQLAEIRLIARRFIQSGPMVFPLHGQVQHAEDQGEEYGDRYPDVSSEGQGEYILYGRQ